MTIKESYVEITSLVSEKIRGKNVEIITFNDDAREDQTGVFKANTIELVPIAGEDSTNIFLAINGGTLRDGIAIPLNFLGKISFSKSIQLNRDTNNTEEDEFIQIQLKDKYVKIIIKGDKK